MLVCLFSLHSCSLSLFLLLLLLFLLTGGTRMDVGEWHHCGHEPCRLALYAASGCARITHVWGNGDPSGWLEPGVVLDPLGFLGEATDHFGPCFSKSGPLARPDQGN